MELLSSPFDRFSFLLDREFSWNVEELLVKL